jgi:hypothetical protein
MKLTKSKLKEIIREEIQKLNELSKQKELDNIAGWLRKTSEDYDDWEWDGKVLTIFDGNKTEKYTKKELKAFKVI